MFYPADWDPESQAILSAFSALTDQFSSCHVSTLKSEPWGTNFKWKWRFSRRPSLAAPRTAWAATARGLEATSPSPSRSSQIHPDSWLIGEKYKFLPNTWYFCTGIFQLSKNVKRTKEKKNKICFDFNRNYDISFLNRRQTWAIRKWKRGFPQRAKYLSALVRAITLTTACQHLQFPNRIS